MFITRKQYEMDLRRAKADGRREALKEVQTIDRMNAMENNFYNSLDRIENRMEKNIERVLQEVKYSEVKCISDCECTMSERCND